MKRYCIILMLLCGVIVTAQKQILYGFDKIPQGLLVNPGAEVGYKSHIGVPVLSGISTNVNVSGVTVADLFRNDNVDFTTKLTNALNTLSTSDYAYINTQIEILSGGYQINERDYLSAGYYTELDAFLTIPRDFISLLRDGNAGFVGNSFVLSDVSVKTDLLSVLHFGITRKFNENFIGGVRFKIYSGLLNVTSTGNEGVFTTELGTTGIYEHSLDGVSLEANSSGFYNENNEIDMDVESILGNAFFGANLGFGFDIGFTYKLDDQFEWSASLLDFGFISYADKTRSGTVEGSYSFSGLEFQYDRLNANYWQELNDDFNANILRNENTESYSVLRPVKFNTALKYGFGKSRSEENCSDIGYNSYYDNAVGIHLHSVFHPIGGAFGLTGFYERKISENFNTKVTYTVDDFSYTNFGVGVSAYFWKLNMYGMIGNVLKLSDIADANTASFQLGINVILD
ncbi:DUF5723 family protein [Tenacibaculum sp. M341]|uniref:DUF5723 family protein n=1 Tax=Tenacibaculum sp. M341 TaxID=2530339 RepID=UPI001052BE05|nr:DUF5723 family protein [Tenacibaculum sp. M341]TCI92535.1 hypothetical protein EYW44_06450 [Tenacibaculum sp. M341]